MKLRTFKEEDSFHKREIVEENMRRFAHVVSTQPIAWDKEHKLRTTIY